MADRLSLASDLGRLGLSRGDLIMLHSSFKSLGPVDGGPEAVIDAVMDVVGPKGGMIVFASWDRTPYDAIVVGGGLSERDREDWPAFDPATSGVKRVYAGVLGTVLATREGAARSANPDRSLAGLGARGVEVVADHALDHGFGPGSPLARFVEDGGKSVLLGAPLSTVTAIHYAEYLCDVPGKHTVTYEVPVLGRGKRIWRPVEQMRRDGFVDAVENAVYDHVERTVEAYVAARGSTPGKVGGADTWVFDAADIVNFAVAEFEHLYGGG